MSASELAQTKVLTVGIRRGGLVVVNKSIKTLLKYSSVQSPKNLGLRDEKMSTNYFCLLHYEFIVETLESTGGKHGGKQVQARKHWKQKKKVAPHQMPIKCDPTFRRDCETSSKTGKHKQARGQSLFGGGMAKEGLFVACLRLKRC